MSLFTPDHNQEISLYWLKARGTAFKMARQPASNLLTIEEVRSDPSLSLIKVLYVSCYSSNKDPTNAIRELKHPVYQLSWLLPPGLIFIGISRILLFEDYGVTWWGYRE